MHHARLDLIVSEIRRLLEYLVGGPAPAFATIVVKPEDFVSPTKGNNGVGNGVDPQPPGNPPVNDGPGTSPGNPGNKNK